MEQITIQISDKRKARALKDFLKSLEYVDKISSTVLNIPASKRIKKAEFFAMAGVWEKRKIDLQFVRRNAWPGRS